ncbi:hypothetical protein ACUN9V_00550 [Salinicola sp. V024]|uniref:hypothetical protein n=1 Tax=Salinicola sp. V024 TaxID=3459609 RepID=UPI0040449DA3
MNISSDSRSHGIQALLDSLREQGIDAGRQEATRLVEEAQLHADWVLAQAQEAAEQIKQQAEDEAHRLRQSGHQALTLAYRDLCLTAKDTFSHQFSAELEKLVGETLGDPDILARLMLEVARRSPLPAEVQGEALLPMEVIGVEELRQNPQALHEGALSTLLAQVARQMLEQGITLRADREVEAGVRFLLDQGRIHVDLTDKSIATLLLRHLQPRFRALLEGVVA